ncbi:ras association domain-containing protein 10 [Procambarus clarkii]|uniref:ras association domain-containing protein 10 n=1 Tax=Procambarus clarkii TaxID=6728 RepID=UPI003742A2C8
MTSEVEIGVWVEGVQKWVTGVTRRTTCHDLVKALLRAQPGAARADDGDVMHYVIVERWRKVERPLDHEQRILKVWRTWGEAVGEVRFSLRRVRDDEAAGDNNSSCGRPERSRRRQKWRHIHGSKEALHPKTLAREDHKFSETMERLMRLVVAQGETIQTQLRRLQEREQQIEQYEQQMHLLRVQNLGTDYLLHSYLKDDQGEAKDEPSSEEKSNDSGVVTEEVVEGSQSVESVAGLEDIQEFASILARMEEVNIRLLHEEETLASMATSVNAAYEQHNDEAELLQQELLCVSHIHAQLVTDARQNEQTLRETEAILWEQRKQLELLLKEDTESDLETRALRQHLDYIIHLPPSAFQLPGAGDSPPQPATAATTARVPPVSTLKNNNTDLPRVSTTRQSNQVTVEDKDAPPPLPLCPPPPLPSCPPPITEEDEEDDRDSAKNSSLCVSSRSSTSSEASANSINTTTSATPAPSKVLSSSSSSHPLTSSKTNEAGGKDTDSTDSNSDTGLSSLHSSSDEGVYVLDTLV